jgi:hypothetical protein
MVKLRLGPKRPDPRVLILHFVSFSRQEELWGDSRADAMAVKHLGQPGSHALEFCNPVDFLFMWC